MFVRAVAGIDDAGIDDAREKMRRAGSAVADYDEVRVESLEVSRGVAQGFTFFQRGSFSGEIDEVRVESLEVSRGVAQGFTFFQRGSFSGEIDDVRGKPLFGKFETDARPRRWLDEKIDDGVAAQCRHFFDGALANGLEGPGRVQDGDDLVWIE